MENFLKESMDYLAREDKQVGGMAAAGVSAAAGKY